VPDRLTFGQVLDVGPGGVNFLPLTWMYEQGRVALLSPEQDAAVHRDHLPSYYGDDQRGWPLGRLTCTDSKMASPHFIAPVIDTPRHVKGGT
jgi:hypothetical protein